MSGPTVPYSEELHAQKYRAEGENFREAMNRVSSALKDDDQHWKQTRDILMDMRFMPAGRIQASMGSPRAVTPYNCYVSGTIEDSFVAGEGSIMDRAKEAATTMRMGGGIGYDFSTLRPRGASIKKLHSQSSGPVSFMQIFDSVCRCVASSGHRRGAQMGVMRVDHPDIVEFVHAKQNEGSLTGFNVSVAATDEFMRAVQSGSGFDLKFDGEVYDTVDAQELWETIMRSTWDWAEPGVLFIDTINKMNNLAYCETIAATNPCGEQPLPPFGACLLGSFNLVKYLTKQDEGYDIDLDQLSEDIPPIVQAMDNVVDRARYPLPQQKAEAENKRRMGIGITGLANALEAMGMPYGSPNFLRKQRQIQSLITTQAYRASSILARSKGSFNLYDESMYLQSGFIKTLDADTRSIIRENGIRNSHLISIAPTGTISLAADNVSSGIEPVFSHEFDRTVIEFDGPRVETVVDYGVNKLGVRGRKASDVTLQEHLDVFIEAQQHSDSAVSKTLNVPSSVDWDQFNNVYMKAWEGGCKGCTTFRVDGKRGGVLVEKKSEPEEIEACVYDPSTGRRSCD